MNQDKEGWFMSQTTLAGSRFGSASSGKIINVGLWILQIGAAGMFLMVGFFKLSGDPQMVGLFDAIGLGQWFRYLTGSLEVLGAVLLLVPRLSGLGALLLVCVMMVAVTTHVFVIAGSPLMAGVLFFAPAILTCGRRYGTIKLFEPQK